MTQFYISVIFIGIILVALSLVWIFYDRKKAYDYTKNVESMKLDY
jgi:cell division protein FtsL